MASKIEVSIDVIIHATEDIQKFYDSFEKMFGAGQDAFSAQSLEGHYENPITMLGGRFAKKDADEFAKKLVGNISRHDLDEIVEDLDELVSGSGLHLRFGKQAFVEGRLAVQEKDAIKVKIYTPVYNKKETADAYLAILERPN